MLGLVCGLLCFLLATTVSAGTTPKIKKVFELPPTEVKAEVPSSLFPTFETTTTLNPDLEPGVGWAEDPTSYLREMPSIFVEGSPRGKKLFLRDLPERDMEILLNGVPIGQRGVYHARGFEWSIIPLDFIEKFEVTRGLPSPEYGNAISGVVNMVTKTGTKKPKTTLKASYGRFDDWKVTLSHSRTIGPLGIFLGGSYRDSSPYLENNRIQDYGFFGSTNLDLKKYGSLKIIGFDFKRLEGYVLDRRIMEHSMSASSFYKYAHGSYYNLERQALQGIYTSSWVDISLSYTRELRNENPKKSSWSPKDVSDYKHDFRTYVLKLKLHHTLGGHHLGLGGEAITETWNDRWERGLMHIRRDNFSQGFLTGFAEDKWSPTKKLTLSYGIRYDYFRNRINGEWKRVDDQFSPRFSITYNLTENIKVYGSVARIFKSPNMADLSRWYGNYQGFSPSGNMIRNWLGLSLQEWRDVLGKIKPSKGWDYELGAKYEKERFALGVNLFFEDVDDYLVIFPTYYPPTYNIDNLKLWGIELQGKWSPSRYFEIAGSYTFEENDTDGDYLTDALFNKDELFDAPKHLFTVTLRSNPIDNLSLEWQTRIVGRRFAGSGSPISPGREIAELPGYGMSSFRADYTKKIKGVDATFSLSVENVFSKRVWERLDYYTAPISIYGGVKLVF